MKKRLAFCLVICMAVAAFSTFANGKSKFVIGVSNGYIGNGWRTQMIDSIQELGKAYKSKGLISNVIVQNAGLDTNNQIAQIRNMINAGVNVLMIDPNSETALNPVIEEAHSKGITVIAFDQPVTSPYAINVVIDQVLWGKNLAEWLVKQLDGKGNIVLVTGLAGHPANVNRLRGMKAVLEKNPNIKVLAEVNGNWDEASAQQVTSNLVAAYPDIDGVLTQDGMALGVVNAFQAAGRKLPVVTGELMMGFMKKWKELKDSQKFSTYGQNNPPGIGAVALGITVRLLQGKKFKDGVLVDGKTYYYPVKEHIKNQNFDSIFAKYKDKPDSYFIDEWLTEKELDALFH
jgi:ribose transport system substrate-binding protein